MKKLSSNIAVTDNKFRIILKMGEPNLQAEELIQILEQEKIKGIINKELISSLNNKSIIRSLQKELVIAEAPASLRAQSDMIKTVETLADWQSLYPVFETAGVNLNSFKISKQVSNSVNPATIFVRAGEIFLRIKVSETAENLYGDKIKIEPLRPIKYNCDYIREDNLGDEILYYAEKAGYIIHLNGMISIESPMYDIDEYERYYIFYPIFADTESLERDYQNALDFHREKFPTAPIALPGFLTEAEPVHSSDIIIKEFCKGTKPINGKDAEIKIFIHEETLNTNKNSKSFKHYLTVKKNEVIAEKRLRVEGVKGRNLFGNIIEVREGKDKILKTNELIREDYKPDKIIYTAVSDGILKISENSIILSEAMIVPGYVDYSTGNIEYGKDVYVSKDIKPRFKVKTEGDLIVKGSIEDRANVIVQGDLLVEGGVVGQNTKIFVKGNATIKFIQDADIYVSGELRVKTSLIGGKVFTGESLVVMGKKGSNRTQVFGGEYCSFVKMELPSVGSSYKKTKLCCGYNPRIEGLIKISEDTVKSIESQISRLLNSIEINITNPAARRLIAKLSSEKKELLKEKLIELKKLTMKLNKLKERRADLIDKLYSKQPAALEIMIKEKLIPETTVTFMKTSLNIKKDTFSCRIKIDDEGIDILNL
jgi:hypothetical protein